MIQVSNQRLKRWRGWLILLIVVLAVLIYGYATGNQATVLTIFKALGIGLLGITLLVTVHELGHFLTAKMFGIRVETFSIGFPPRIFSTQRGETRYQIGALPLGGYVKIAGMIDESLDQEVIEKERARERGIEAKAPEPWEFRSKPVWQRLIVMSGGVIMNVLLAILIFSIMYYRYGDSRVPVSKMDQGIYVGPNSIGERLGFQTGDRLLTANGEAYPYLSDYVKNSILRREGYFTVMRRDQELRIDIPRLAINMYGNDSIADKSLFSIPFPSRITIDSSMQNGPAARAGMRSGDRIIRLDDHPVPYWPDLRKYMTEKECRKERDIRITYVRQGDTLEAQARLDSAYKMHVLGQPPDIPMDKVSYAFFESFVPGTRRAFFLASTHVASMSRMAEPGVKTGKLVSGPLRIFKIFLSWVEADGLRGFMEFTAILSMILAVMNILPIPALDGGHIVFLLYEAVTRREPSVRVRMIAQQVGLVLVLLLMGMIIFNDAIQLILGGPAPSGPC